MYEKKEDIAINPVTTLKSQHRHLTLDMLHKYNVISRNDVSKELKVSVQTAMKIMKYLEDYRFVKSAGEKEADLGRKPQLYALNNDKFFFIGIVYEGSVIRAGIVNLSLELVLEDSAEMKNTIEEVLVTQTVEIAQKLIIKLKETIGESITIVSLGIGFPGVVNDKEREISFAPTLSITDPHSISPLVSRIEKELQLPVFLENNVNAAVLGLQNNATDTVLLALGSGIGMGIIIDNKLRKGVHFRAGEIGTLNTTSENSNIEDSIGLKALEKKWHFSHKEPLTNIPKENFEEMIEYLASETTKIIATTTAILDISDFFVGGITLDLFGSDLFEKIEEKISKLHGFQLKLQYQSTSKASLIGICKKAFNESIDPLLLSDNEI